MKQITELKSISKKTTAEQIADLKKMIETSNRIGEILDKAAARRKNENTRNINK